MTFPSDADSLAAWASAYAANGWPVFPLAPRGKQPVIKNGRGFEDATVHPDQIADWWRFWPDANIGLPTGITFDVLDVDGPEAADALARYITEYTETTTPYRHPGPVTRTGKGWHFLFDVTTRGNGAKLLPDTNLDFRGIGGYIAAPPSVHPNGHRYLWVPGRGPELAPAPITEWLVPLLTRETKGKREHVQWDALRPARDNWTLIATGQVLKDQLPRAIRQRADRPDILEIWQRRYAATLRDRGNYAVTSCPFHEDSTPSFTLYPDNTFHCYGCGAHGDSFDLDKDQPTHI